MTPKAPTEKEFVDTVATHGGSIARIFTIGEVDLSWDVEGVGIVPARVFITEASADGLTQYWFCWFRGGDSTQGIRYLEVEDKVIGLSDLGKIAAVGEMRPVEELEGFDA